MAKKKIRKNIRSIPSSILARIRSFEQNEFVAGCLLKIRTSDIKDGDYTHIGIKWEEGTLSYRQEIVPPEAAGKYSRWNIRGREIVHNKEPKTKKTFSRLMPDWGDWSRGSHFVYPSREVYRREWWHPQNLRLFVTHVGEENGGYWQTFKFVVEGVFTRTTNFTTQLLFSLNILQENVQNCNVFERDASIADYMASVYVNWEILPAGEGEKAVERILTGMKNLDPKVREELVGRKNFLISLEPTDWVVGTNGFRGYFGAKFADDLVVLENLQYGNAIYVMFEKWEELSKKSRTELLSSTDLGKDFVRIPHTTTWKRQLRARVRSELRKRQRRGNS